MLYIQPDECVDCGACEPVCPVEAIYYEDDLPREVVGLLQGERRVLRRGRVARRRGQGRGHPLRPPVHRGAAAAAPGHVIDQGRSVEQRRSTDQRRVPVELPDFPWDELEPLKAKAAEHPHGLVDLSVGTPVDPTREQVQRALAGAADAPGYPATVGIARAARGDAGLAGSPPRRGERDRRQRAADDRVEGTHRPAAAAPRCPRRTGRRGAHAGLPDLRDRRAARRRPHRAGRRPRRLARRDCAGVPQLAGEPARRHDRHRRPPGCGCAREGGRCRRGERRVLRGAGLGTRRADAQHHRRPRCR